MFIHSKMIDFLSEFAGKLNDNIDYNEINIILENPLLNDKTILFRPIPNLNTNSFYIFWDSILDDFDVQNLNYKKRVIHLTETLLELDFDPIIISKRSFFTEIKLLCLPFCRGNYEEIIWNFENYDTNNMIKYGISFNCDPFYPINTTPIVLKILTDRDNFHLLSYFDISKLIDYAINYQGKGDIEKIDLVKSRNDLLNKKWEIFAFETITEKVVSFNILVATAYTRLRILCKLGARLNTNTIKRLAENGTNPELLFELMDYIDNLSDIIKIYENSSINTRIGRKYREAFGPFYKIYNIQKKFSTRWIEFCKRKRRERINIQI